MGSVVCLKKVAVEEYQGRPQLSAHSRLSYWAVLEEKSDGSLGVATNNDSLVILSDADKQRGRTLKEWAGQTSLVPGGWMWSFGGGVVFVQVKRLIVSVLVNYH